ncbi:hypothetical protein TcasGA2_TC007108 [Tribolium castaneum]|uniref:Uncharacterized protein n=1 Tax=Tribolium castaneum TaxID=7070 RepID=D2A1D4_TRICA|nr:hypothetical protein TcasGA2_TC007108 [Tribolium castaneum]
MQRMLTEKLRALYYTTRFSNPNNKTIWVKFRHRSAPRRCQNVRFLSDERVFRNHAAKSLPHKKLICLGLSAGSRRLFKAAELIIQAQSPNKSDLIQKMQKTRSGDVHYSWAFRILNLRVKTQDRKELDELFRNSEINC